MNTVEISALASVYMLGVIVAYYFISLIKQVDRKYNGDSLHGYYNTEGQRMLTALLSWVIVLILASCVVVGVNKAMKDKGPQQ